MSDRTAGRLAGPAARRICLHISSVGRRCAAVDCTQQNACHSHAAEVGLPRTICLPRPVPAAVH